MNALSFNQVLRMQNIIQSYAWGSRTALAELMGEASPSAHPQAELWMGAHPKAPSKVWFEHRWQPLNQLIDQYPNALLGDGTVARFGGTLPFLFKLLAAGQPLSIQAHPDGKQAKAGFKRENRQGIALDAAQRNYKDDRHKPECICAITPFQGLCGFRTWPDMMSLIGSVWPLQFNHMLSPLKKSFTANGMKQFFQSLMGLNAKQRKGLLTPIVEKAGLLSGDNAAFHWISELQKNFSFDVGVLFPLLLNIIELAPGEAVFLPPRQMHSYLSGLGD